MALALDPDATAARLQALLVATARRAGSLKLADASALVHAARR
jgi:hypothetical protein